MRNVIRGLVAAGVVVSLHCAGPSMNGSGGNGSSGWGGWAGSGGGGNGGTGGNGGNGGGGAGGGGGTTSGGGGNGGGAGPVSLLNASARASSSGGTSYDITFTLRNDEWDQNSIEQVQVVQFDWTGTMLKWSGACSGSPWSIPAAVTNVIEIHLLANTGAPQASADVPCNSNYNSVDVGMPATAPSGAINLDIEGILSDATPFKVSASAPIL